MEAFTCANSVTGDFGCKSCLNSHCFSSKPLCVGPQQCAYNNAEETLNRTPLEDVDIHDDLGKSEKENSEVAELEIALNEVVRVEDVNGQLSARNKPNPDGEVCPELKIHLSGSSGVKMQKGLNKCATFPVSEKVQSSEEIPSIPQNSQSSLKSENPAYTRSLSLPPEIQKDQLSNLELIFHELKTTLKLVSAMKGGRKAHGKPSSARLSVKWAPGVYDPPANSLSHTVKNHYHQHRPKSKKKDHHKHKYKGKSSRGCGSEKKHVSSRRSTGNTSSDHLSLRMHAPGDRMPLDGFAQSGAELLEYTASSQESKCGSSFLMESLAKVQLSSVNC